ncbi:MAG TPA: thymidine phosphorylase [Patescibacteria group bacterium]|nr:thymidine phosphorylase [Patescibacteria group bacterium]
MPAERIQRLPSAILLKTLELRETRLPAEKRLTREDLKRLCHEKPTLPQGITPFDILVKTRDRQESISRDEMFGFVNGIVSGAVSTEQTAAWLGFVRLNGLTQRETVNLTLAMAASGEILDFDYLGNVADKHSSGGVGDKTTLVVAPLVAACDVNVGKMSGKGLGHTGGTIDKLESIPGISMQLDAQHFRNQLETIGIVISGQSHDLAPADGILYSLRDKTATIDSIPLIAASIMSKKIASGANTLVLDVKVGKGAFMKTLEEAQELSRIMVDIGKAVGIHCIAEISDMNQPLGNAVGNALELKEAIDTLKGNGPDDFKEHCIETAAEIVLLAGKAATHEEARLLVEQQLGEDGRALQKFGEMIAAQGGDPNVLIDPDQLMPPARYQHAVVANAEGYLSSMDPEMVGKTSMTLGAGRPTKDAPVEDYAAGIMVSHKIGDRIHEGDVIFTIHTNDETRIADAEQALHNALSFSDEPVSPYPLRYDVIR